MATKIYCASIDCKFCNEKGVCTAKNVELSWHSVMTVNEGRQYFNKCKAYELSEEAKEIYGKVRDYFENYVGQRK